MLVLKKNREKEMADSDLVYIQEHLKAKTFKMIPYRSTISQLLQWNSLGMVHIYCKYTNSSKKTS